MTRLADRHYTRVRRFPESPMKQLTEQLVSWIRQQVSGANARGTVTGISGGIDSSVVAVLCKLAFPETTLGLVLPCHSNETDIRHGYAVASKFQIPVREIVLDGVYDTLVAALAGDDLNPATPTTAEANLKPRLRMATLYYFAARLRYLVVGSSNKCELQVGYFTKYGDGGVDILPLGNLVKSQVRSLAQYLDVPGEIIHKPPSAGLWEGQTDEQEMGLTYEQLDLYCTAGHVDEDVRRRIEERILANAHKSITPPIPPF